MNCADSARRANTPVMDGLVAPEPMATDPLATIAQRVMARLRVWARHAATFGSAGSMVLAAMLGAAAFAFALAAPSPPVSATSPAAVRAPELRGRLIDISTPVSGALGSAAPANVGPGALTPIGAPPAAAIETALDYDVVFFWPARPQTVSEPVAIRQGPASYALLIRSARPGERLRINGRVEDAPNGPWLRVRLADGQDGYLAARTIDVGAFRHRRAVEATQVAETDVTGEAAGAPLAPLQPDEYGDPDVGPPSF